MRPIPLHARLLSSIFPKTGFFRETHLIPDENKTPKEQELHNGYATTKPIPAASPLKNMASFPGETIRHSLLRFIVPAVLVILVIPSSGMASTPPVQPSLLIAVSNNSSGQDLSIGLLLTWNGYVSYNKPPEYIIVEAFSVAEGTRLGAFPVSRQTDPCETEHTCIYSTSVSTATFPPGTFMLVATDPLSGVSARQQVTISTAGEGSKNFFTRFDREQGFIVVSVVLAAFLVAVLAVLVGKDKSG